MKSNRTDPPLCSLIVIALALIACGGGSLALSAWWLWQVLH